MNLKDTTKEVFKENIRMAEALRHHVEQGEELSKVNTRLQSDNRKLEEDHDLHNVIVKEKIHQTKSQTVEVFTTDLDIAA
jgi:guanylate kinase